MAIDCAKLMAMRIPETEQTCDHDPTRIVGLDGRFTSPVFPGETLRTAMWRDGAVVSHRTRVVEREVVVLDHGRAAPAV